MVAKLTVSLPEDLRHRARELAAARGETLSEVVRVALENYIAELLEEAEDVRAVQDIEARMESHEEPVISWSEFEVELDGLPS